MKKRKKMKILKYSCVFQEEKEGGFSVWVPLLPGCASQGETFEEAQDNIKEAIKLYLEDSDTDELEEYKSDNQFVVPVSIPFYA